jgi:hypothetical protein
MTHTAITGKGKRFWKLTILILLALTVVYFAWRLSRDEPETFKSDEMQFKYGSTGGDKNFGIPFVIWDVLPVMFKDKLPKGREAEGWGAFGFITDPRDYADGSESPRYRRAVGTTLRNYMGLERTFLNCAACHAGLVRKSDGQNEVVLGMPSNTVDLEAFQFFLTAVAADPRFNPQDVLAAIDAQGLELDVINRLALRFIAVDQMKTLINGIGKRFEFTKFEPAFGPGRFDTFSPAKALLNWPHDYLDPKERIGVVDFPSIWLQEQKREMWLHWDGNNNKLKERNRSAAFGTGANFPILDRTSVERMENFILSAKPPSLTEFTGTTLDVALVEKGRPIYARLCANCHGASGTDFSGDRVGQTTPIKDIGTDRFRFDNYTYDLLINQSQMYAGNAEERFQNFRKSDGYANMPLDGLWLRAPFLHNGSVPTLRDLLKPAADRPIHFYRGSTDYDPVDLGFISRKDAIRDDTRSKLFCLATNAQGETACGADRPQNNDTCDALTCKGNGNGGHEYGTELAEPDKNALIEYLKTF